MVIDEEPPPAPEAVAWETYVAEAGAGLRALLAAGADEPALQDWLERHPAWVPGIDGGRGAGHHGPLHGAVITQPPLRGLGTKVPDFLCLTSTSGVLIPVLTEIEDPKKRWFTAKGHPTANLTQAQDQLRDWRAWFDRSENQQVFLATYDVPSEMRSSLALRPAYHLVYGRQGEFDRHGPHSDGHRLNRKRVTLAAIDEEYQTWDSLSPGRANIASVITAHVGDTGYQAVRVPDTIDLRQDIHGTCAQVSGLHTAIEANERIPPARRRWLTERAQFWQAEAARRAAGGELRIHR